MHDPYDKILPPVKLSEMEEDPDPRLDLDLVFGEYTPPNTSVLDSDQPVLYTDVCRFDETGSHTYMADKCPHYDMFDETGRNIREGWTVQGG